jgi:hypothetical protein
MAISIPDTLSSQPAPLPDADPIPSPVEDVKDTVKLSEDAQIRLLTQQGQSPDEIAQNLGVAVSTVEGYLGVVVASVAPAPPAPRTSARSLPRGFNTVQGVTRRRPPYGVEPQTSRIARGKLGQRWWEGTVGSVTRREDKLVMLSLCKKKSRADRRPPG